jgi:hypothetical protein
MAKIRVGYRTSVVHARREVKFISRAELVYESESE